MSNITDSLRTPADKKRPRHYARSSSHMERARRIELPYSAWEADVLPLNYARDYLSIIHDFTCSRNRTVQNQIKKTC